MHWSFASAHSRVDARPKRWHRHASMHSVRTDEVTSREKIDKHACNTYSACAHLGPIFACISYTKGVNAEPDRQLSNLCSHSEQPGIGMSRARGGDVAADFSFAQVLHPQPAVSFNTFVRVLSCMDTSIATPFLVAELRQQGLKDVTQQHVQNVLWKLQAYLPSALTEVTPRVGATSYVKVLQ